MSIKRWNVTVKLFWDASKIVSIEVKANTKRKAEIKGKEEAVERYKCNNPDIISIEEIVG